MAGRFVPPATAAAFIRDHANKKPDRSPKMIELRERIDQMTETLKYFYGVYSHPFMWSWKSAEEVVGMPRHVITQMRLALDGVTGDTMMGRARWRWEDLPGKPDLCAADIVYEAAYNTESVMLATGVEVFAMYLDASTHPGIFERFLCELLDEARLLVKDAVAGDKALEGIVNDPAAYFAATESDDPITDVITLLRTHIPNPTRDVSHAIGAVLAFGQKQYATCVQLAEVAIMGARSKQYLGALAGRGTPKPQQIEAIEAAELMKAQIMVDLLKQ